MALTLSSEQRLAHVGLTDFFQESPGLWLRLAREAYTFLQKTYPKGAAIRRDDVSDALVPLLEVHEELRRFLNEAQLHQRYWIRDSADLIVDRYWAHIIEDDG